MAIFLKDFGTIKKELQTDIGVALPQASQARNSVVNDLFINPNSTQLAFLFRSIQQIIDSTQLNTLASADLDKYAENFGLRRKPGTTATGSVVFVLDNSFDQNKDIEIASGAILTAQGGTGSVSFRTTLALFLRREDRQIYAAIAEGYRDSLRQAGITDVTYAVEVPIQATVAGTRGIVGTYSITQGRVSNVKNIINLAPTSGGFDSESDASLRQRIALVIAGNSVGTVDGVKKAAVNVTGVTSAFVVTPGNPLMTRDGTVYDENGAILQEGRGNALDIYVYGQLNTDTNESYVFQEDTTTVENISLAESIVLGTATSSIEKRQPVVSVGAISGLQSGNNFQLATEQTDEDGNIVLEGHVALVKDFEASSYSLVRNTTTNELAIARYLNPNSSRYAVVQKLESSPNANSVKGEDRLIFLRKYAVVENEIVARGSQLNGADALRFSDVAKIRAIEEDVKVERELVKISTEGAFQVQTRHAPIVSVTQVKHVRLGTVFTAQISDATRGLINLTGRFAPQAGDYLEITYVWRKSYLPGFEYFLQEDSVNWVQPDFQIENDSLTIFNGDYAANISLDYQPLTPTFLSIALSNATKRAEYNFTVTGDIADMYLQYQPTYAAGSTTENARYVFNTQLFARTDAADSHIGRVTRLRNLTKGFDYNLTGYELYSNRFAPEANINTNLQKSQFAVNEAVNTTIVEIGDYVQFNAPRKNANWGSYDELSNNIKGNIKPVYDETKILIDQASAEIRLQQPESNPNLPETVAPAIIATDTTWSGRVRIDDNLTIARDVTLTIQPGTVVTVVNSSSLPSAIEVLQRVRLVRIYGEQKPTLPVGYLSAYYVFFNPTGLPFFVVLSDDGTEDFSINYNSDIIQHRKQLDETYAYEINGFPVEKKFWNSLEKALASQGSLVSSLVEEIQPDSSKLEIYYSYSVTRFGVLVYILPLENEPRLLSPTVYDVLLRDINDRNRTAVVSYEPTTGKYGIVGGDLATGIEWQMEYGVEVINRATITVAGAIVADAPTAEEPIIFTSFSGEQAPGDWGGIVFEASSSSITAPTRSVLRNCIIKYTDVAIQTLNSDPLIDRCVVKNYLSAGGISRSEPSTLVKYRTNDFELLSSIFSLNAGQRVRILGTEGIPQTFPVVTTTTPAPYGDCGYGYGYGYEGYGYCGYGYGGCSGTPTAPSQIVSSAYVAYKLPIRPLTASEEGSGTRGIPTITSVSKTRAVLGMTYGVDYTVYIGDEDITSKAIQTFEDCSQAFLIPGVDFNLELDLSTYYPEIVFYNTKNMQAFLYVYANSLPRSFSVTYTGVRSTGEVTNCIFQNAINPAWICQSGSDVTFVNNTFYRTGSVAVRIENSYVTLRNNIIAEYSTTPIAKDPESIIFSARNNMYSSFILANEPHRPIDTDTLLSTMEIDEIILPVRLPNKYKSGLILKIDDEYMEILQVGIEVRVKRGSFDSVAAKHQQGSRIVLLRKKTFFSITGLPAKYAQLLLTDTSGTILETAQPVNMLQVEPNSFRIAIPVDRQNSVYYRYRYWDSNPKKYSETPITVLPAEQFGDAVNDLFSTAYVAGISASNNYSADPKFVNEKGDNYALTIDSPCNVANELYSTPWNPSIPYNKYIGIIPRAEAQYLAENTKIVKLAFPFLAADSLVESISIENALTKRKILPQSYNAETNEITLVSPVSLRNSGNYVVSYNSPISLGTNLPGNQFSGTVQYQFDAKQTVQFTKFKVLLEGDGGVVRFAYRIAARVDLLQNSTFSNYITVGSSGEIDLLALEAAGNTASGSIVEFILDVQGNDGSYSNTGDYLYPRIKNFTLSYAPALDTQQYEIKEVRYVSQTERTRVYLDPIGQQGVGILSSTAAQLANSEEVVFNVQKRGSTSILQLGRVRSLNTGDKFVDLLGNYVAVKTAPSVDDVIEADIMYVSRGSSEIVPFTSSSTQLTTNRFVGVTSISAETILDRVSQAPGNERVRIDITNQPIQGTGYEVTYTFEAPKNQETLTVSFIYNSLIQSVQSQLDANKDALADVLARQMFGVDVVIAANVVITTGFNPSEVVANLTRAVAAQFTLFISENPTGGGRIDATDTLAVIKNVDGVDDLALTAHYRSGFSGVTNIAFNEREYPVLAQSSPQIVLVSASDPNTILSVET